MRRHLAALVFLLCAVLPVSAEELLFKSNDFGMLLSRITETQQGDSRWVLRVRRTGTDEQRMLYDKGKEVRQWDVSWNRDHTEKVERETAAGALVARRVYDASGSLLQEEEYASGVLSRKTLSTYAGGRLTRTRVLDGADGREVSSAVYLYAANGSLREVRRTVAPGETSVSAVVIAGTGLSEQRSSQGGSLFIERFDTDGRMTNRERRTDGTTVSTEEFTYDGTTRTPAASEERLPGDNSVIARHYDDAGRVSDETTSVKGAVRETVMYQRNEKGKVTTKSRRSPDGLESWKYTYADSGDLSREEYFRRGILAKVTDHGTGKLRTEEMYREGELFLKVYYDGDTRLREEVYTNGTVQRERSYP
jgi:hypothetical protein